MVQRDEIISLPDFPFQKNGSLKLEYSDSLCEKATYKSKFIQYCNFKI